MADTPNDVVVIGGGPAGSAAARLLAAWGRSVLVLAGVPARRPPLAESLPPSCRKLLTALGVLDDVAAAGFVPCRGNSSAWGGGALRAERFVAETGWQVLRDRFDDVLLRCAHAAGARIAYGASAQRVELPEQTGRAEAVVCWHDAAGVHHTRARWVLDCSGRAGLVARRGLRRRDPVPPTLALLGIWQSAAGWDVADESHTIVESYRDGWAWSVPVAPATRYVAAMIDPRRTRLTRGDGITALYDGEIQKTVHVRQLLHGGVRHGAAWACSAVTYHASRYAVPGCLLVGDAGSFLDPLSSAGVKKALASASLAAVAVHTSLVRPSMRTAALALFEQRERVAHAHYSRLAARHYADAAAYHAHPFWISRAQSGREDGGEELEAERDSELERDPRVRAAFEALRSGPPPRLRPTAQLARVRQPTVNGREVVLEDRLVSPAAPAGVRFFRGVDLPAVIDVAAEHADVPELFAAYARIRPPVRLPDFIGAVSALVALGMLERTGTAEPSTLELR